jgi:hypothetical protein
MRIRYLVSLPLALALGGCFPPDNFDRPGFWTPNGANEANLRAMIVDPSQLERGAAPPTLSRGQSAAIGAGLLAPNPNPAAGGGGSNNSFSPTRVPVLPRPSGTNTFYVGN